MTGTPKEDPDPSAAKKNSRVVLVAWALYDWANNGFATVILRFIFSAYFTRRIAPDDISGSTLWGNMVSIAGLFVALGGPVCGAAADQSGRRKPWLVGFMLLCVLATVLLWFMKPSTDYILPALILVGVGIVGAEYSYMIYIDALATIFAMGGVYAAGAFQMSEREVLLFGIVLNIAAGLGALVFSGLDDSFGPRAVIPIALCGLTLGGLVILIVHARIYFWLAGTFMGLFVGPVQAASRSYMARAAPTDLRTQMFGLYAFSGKVTAFAGPLLVGWLTYLSGSQRIGMGSIIVLLLVGAALMLRVPPSSAAKGR
jgi:MFS-type transporter involved in bile tolerance (Atg22 family)